jgi:hypothetical protein
LTLLRARSVAVALVLAAAGAAGLRAADAPPPSGADAARAAAERFLDLIDAGKSSGSWDATAQMFKDATAKGPWAQTLHRVRYPLGKVLSRKFKSAEPRTSPPGLPEGDYVVVQFETRFENKGDALETVVPTKEKDGVWRVAMYFIK